MNFFQRRKIKKHLKELRACVNYSLAADDDILTVPQKNDLAELKKELDSLNVENSAASLRSIENRLGAIIPTEGFAHFMRGMLDVLIVACTVAGGIRALYLQPFKIPTSSMQPTLFGIHYIDNKAAAPHLGPLTKTFMPIQSERAYVKINSDGSFGEIRKQTKFFFFTESLFRIGPDEYSAPGDLTNNIMRYLPEWKTDFKAGDVFCDGRLSSGDHVFVERLSIHFRKLKRGDVIVFNTEDIKSPTQPIGGYYYIKRLVGLPGDVIKIADNMLLIKPKGEKEFKNAVEFSDKFKKLYSFKGGYLGHAADGLLADGREITVPENMFFALGDNTYNSLDGRNWGFVPRRNMVGLAVGIFWPVSRRWGVADSAEPLDVNAPETLDLRLQPVGMNMQ